MTEFRVEVTWDAVVAHRVVAMMEEHGLSVAWDPPTERRDINAVEVVVSTVLAVGTSASLKAAAAQIRSRWPRIGLRLVRKDGDDPGDDNPLDN